MSTIEEKVNVGGISLFASDAQAIPSPGWQQVPGGLTQVSAASLNQVWGVNARNSTIYNFQNGVWVNIPGGLSCVSAAADGTVWGVNSSGTIYRREGGSWTKMPGALTQISAGSATQVWGVNSTGSIYQWDGSDWKPVPGALSWVSAAADGTVWGVNSSGNILRRDGGNWKQVPGSLSQISVGSATQVWGVNSAGNVLQWSGGNWVQVPGGLSNVSVASDGTLWGVNSADDIYYYVQAAPLVVFNPRLAEADLEQDETAKYLFDVTNTSPGTMLQNVVLSLLYDKAGFARSGLTAVPDAITLPAALAYGKPVTVSTLLTASASAAPGYYGFYGVSAKYEIVPVPSPSGSAPVSSGSGGWMSFTVVAP